MSVRTVLKAYISYVNYWAEREGCSVFDEMVVQCFLENQLQLYPEKVAETYEEAENFLE